MAKHWNIDIWYLSNQVPERSCDIGVGPSVSDTETCDQIN